jgi:two-component system sensor histidine kinase EvgS
MVLSIFDNPKEFIDLIDHCRSNFNLKENYEDIIDMDFFYQIISKIRIGLETFKCFSLATPFYILENLAKKYKDDVFSWNEMPENLKKTILLCQKTLSSFIKKNELIETQLKTSEELKKSGELLSMALKDKITFFAKMSHELRTPLNAILGFSNILLNYKEEHHKPVSNELFKEYLQCISSSGHSLLGIIDEVHDLSKLELGKIKIIKTSISLPQLINNVSSFFINECSKKGLTFFLDIEDDVPTKIIFDELRLKQVLNNLLSNALKFTKKGHLKIRVWVTREKEVSQLDLNISIQDTGIGMRPQGLKKIFQSFEQVHEDGVIEERGSGLGLFITHKLVNLLNGSIDVKSHFGKGSSFNLIFKNIELVAIIGGLEKKQDFIHYEFNQQLVIIADDVDVNLKLLEAYLSNYHLTIKKASNGQELIDKSLELIPALIITDLKMPDLNGNIAAKKIKSFPQTKDIPIIGLTAASTLDEYKNDFQGLLQKPIHKWELLEEMSKYLKHEKSVKKGNLRNNFIDSRNLNNPSISFKLKKETFSPEEKMILKKIRSRFEECILLMDMTMLEQTIVELKKEIDQTDLSYLNIWFESLHQDTKLFKINNIKDKLSSSIFTLNQIISKMN